MEFKFRNGAKLSVSDQSTATDLILVTKDYNNLGQVVSLFTEENMKGATFGDEILENVVPVNVTSDHVIGESIVYHLNSRVKSDIEILTEKVNDTENALLELAEIVVGGEE